MRRYLGAIVVAAALLGAGLFVATGQGPARPPVQQVDEIVIGWLFNPESPPFLAYRMGQSTHAIKTEAITMVVISESGGRTEIIAGGKTRPIAMPLIRLALPSLSPHQPHKAFDARAPAV